MKTLFKNARILTMKDGPIFLNGHLGIDGNRICYLGEEEPKEIYSEIVDCQGYVLMPGLKNAHTHSAMIAMRGVGEGLELWPWLQEIFKVEARLTPRDVYILSQGAFLEYVRSGITAFFDMYFFAPYIAQAAEDFGMRCANLFMLDENGDRIPTFQEQLRKNDNPDSLVHTILGYHAEYTVGKNELKLVKELSQKYHLPVFTHISETENETKGCIQRRGTTPPMWMEQEGLFDYGGGGYHCIHFSEEDIDLFARKNLHLVSCPCSNEKLNDGTAPLKTYLDKGIEVSLGTDGASSNYSLSFWKELRLVKKNNPGISDYEILTMATVNGAKAMGFLDCDVLDVGKKADFILVDADSIQNLIDKTEDQDVKAVYIDGKKKESHDLDLETECKLITKRLLATH